MLKRMMGTLGGTNILTGVLLLFGVLVAAVGSAIAQPLLVFYGLAASLLGELPLRGRAPGLNKVLKDSSLGYTTRLTIRVALATFAAASADSQLWPLVALCTLAVAIRAIDVVAATTLRRRTAADLLVRNIATPSKAHPGSVPNILVGTEVSRALPTETLVILGLLYSTVSVVEGLVIAAIGTGYGLALVLWSGSLLLRGRRASETDSMSDLQVAINSVSPTVVVYFSGGAEAVYQLNMWLATLEQLGRPILVLLRERSVFNAMEETALPIICVPKAPDLLELEFPTVRVSLYIANVGNNIHFLRLPSIKSVFIGHGDSDKNASFNPYSRVYSEVWVAGQAGRDRYKRANIGVRDSDVREVGRPQAAPLAQGHTKRRHGVPTVLYAPTWEGWNEQQNYCSVATIGLEFIERVVQEQLPIRIVYRPHPFIGKRSPEVWIANNRIIELLKSDNARKGLQVRPPEVFSDTASATDVEGATLKRDRDLFNDTSPSAHIALEPKWKIGLIGSMLAADGMLTDISSVLSDFLATGRPFAVTNPTDLTKADFLTAFPSASAGHLLNLDGSGSEDFTNVLMDVAEDPYAESRDALRTYLLGPHPEAALDSFNEAIDSLIASPQQLSHAGPLEPEDTDAIPNG